MFDRFTDNSIKVIMCAQEEARRLGHNYVETEQILLGLIGDSAGVAGRTLRVHGIELRSARYEVEKIIGRGPGFVIVEIPFTPRSKRVLNSSREEADSMNETSIHTEHLLLGLLKEERENEGIATRVLERLGVHPISIEKTLANMMKNRLENESMVVSTERSRWAQQIQAYFKTLQVDPRAEFRVVFEAYTYLVNKYHADSETRDLLQFKLAHQAWFVIGDEDLRSQMIGAHLAPQDTLAETEKMTTLYQDLQVDQNADLSLIERVYGYLSAKYHPDQKTGDKMKFEMIQDAWMVLSDETKRAEYDSTLKANNTERDHPS